MRTPLLLLMMSLPVGAMAYHYGPGQSQLALDDSQREINLAADRVEKGDYRGAIEAYTEALKSVPSTRADVQRQIRLERAKAQMQNRQLPEAYDELFALKQELDDASASSDAAFLTDFRKTLADAQYYMTWLQRLEGEPREAWEADVEGARQHYKLLASAAREAGDESTAKEREGDLEAAIRLARLDLSELQALPLPKQCQGCCTGTSQCKCNGKKPGQKPAEKKSEDARGASAGPPPDGKGS